MKLVLKTKVVAKDFQCSVAKNLFDLTFCGLYATLLMLSDCFSCLWVFSFF